MQLTHFLKDLEELLSPSLFTDYGPNGLQVEGKSQIKKVAFSVSASLATIQEAAKRGVDVLVVHHGLFWDKDPSPVVGSKKEKLSLLLASQISLVAYHLPLDAHPQLGNNWRAARELGWQTLEPFFPMGNQHLGVRGTFSPRSLEAFQKQLETYYGHSAQVVPGGKKEVASAALISGGAHRFLHAAADAGVDCYITGSLDEMVWDQAHERGINFFALGHYATERIGVLGLMEHVKAQGVLSCEWIDLFNPF